MTNLIKNSKLNNNGFIFFKINQDLEAILSPLKKFLKKMRTLYLN